MNIYKLLYNNKMNYKNSKLFNFIMNLIENYLEKICRWIIKMRFIS